MNKFNVSEEKMKWILKDEMLNDRGTVFEHLLSIKQWLVKGKASTEIPYTEEDFESYLMERADNPRECDLEDN